ncbi:DUF2304 domain-containing protein [Methanobacterium paludis]|uniref:DUF2304 domain-containing protein n=1 Tax=Methanobacterium paludis (strain DSM 25820 / JCM 18151 / SWAN1) TaxID=868131 RepID=F6D684_METPW|nr:DUF2304 domain-containing protein [Methanobacterium paludis]AEG18297.1 Protein of unknown function DUF2304 [Methanobacterium paludis]
MILIYQVIGILLGIVALLLTILRFKDGKMSLGMFVGWILIWLIVIFVSIYPESTSFLAKSAGIGRGLDFVLILGILSCFYLIFKLYNKLETMEEEITDLVRKIAIQNENSGVSDEDNEKDKP